DDRLAAHRVGADLLQRCGRLPLAAALARLREQRERALERDREDLLLALERTGLLSLLHVRAVAAVPRGHLLAVGLADHARQRQELQRLVERDRVERHRLEERRGARLRL